MNIKTNTVNSVDFVRAWCWSPHMCAHTFPGSLPVAIAGFILQTLQELFHWSGPSLVRNTMVTELARADLCYPNNTITQCTNRHIHWCYSDWHAASPQWPQGLTSQSRAAIKAETGRTLLASTRYQQQEQILQNTVGGLQIQKRLLEQLVFYGLCCAWRFALKLFTAGTRNKLWCLDVKLKIQDLEPLVNWQDFGNLSGTIQGLCSLLLVLL